jgi:hypothetical protein
LQPYRDALFRFRFNSFHIEWRRGRGKETHPLNEEEIRHERWSHFQEACNLLGEFYAIKPLLVSQFRGISEDVNLLHQGYQQWRRQIGGNKAVLQSETGKSDQEYKDIRETYQKVIQVMRTQV